MIPATFSSLQAIWTVVILLLLLGVSTSVCGQLPMRSLNKLSLTVEDGLAQSRVDDMVYDKEGILWMKLKHQLQLWDGHEVISIEDTIIENSLDYSISIHKESGILVSTPGLLRRFQYQGLKKEIIYKSNVRTEREYPLPLYRAGHLYILTSEDSLLMLADDYSLISTEAAIFSDIYDGSTNNIIDIDGYKYIVGLSREKLLPFGKVSDRVMAQVYLERSFRQNIISHNGQIMQTKNLGISFYTDKGQETYRYPDGRSADYYSSMLVMDGNTLLVGIDNDLFQFNIKDKKWTLAYKNTENKSLLRSGYFDLMLRDKYNNIWVVAVSEGIKKLYMNDRFDKLEVADKGQRFVKNVTIDNTSGWVVTSRLNNGIFFHDSLGNLIIHLDKSTLPILEKSVTGVFAIGHKTFAFNVNHDHNIYMLDMNESTPRVSIIGKKSVSYLYYQDAVRCDDGSFLFIFNDVLRYNPETKSLKTLFQYAATKSCAEIVNDWVWIGANDALIKYNWKLESDLEHIPLIGQGYVRSIAASNDSVLIVGTDRGIYEFNIRSEILNKIHDECTYCLQLDDNGKIWAGTGKGIVSVDDGGKEKFGLADGLQGLEYNTAACMQSDKGKMYFGGLEGTATFYPDDVSREDMQYPVVIKSMTQGNDKWMINKPIGNSKSYYSFEYDESNIQFYIAAQGGYESDEYNYQYHVDGITNGWTDGEKQNKYNFNLSPGKYKFYFAATLEYDGDLPYEYPIWINISKPWWASWWFYTLLSIFIAGLATYIITSINRQNFLKEKYKQDLKLNLQEERINMSKELHDNIGARLTFLVSSLGNMKPNIVSDKTASKLDQLADFGKDTINDLRSYMWVLSSEKITLQDLQLKTLDFINFARSSFPNIDFEYQGVTTNADEVIIPSQASTNIYRIVQEAIQNLVKYSEATEANISFCIKDAELVIIIKDNGVGFDQSAKHKGFGLGNMRSRTTKSGGTLEISSELNAGTIIQLIVPI